MTDNELINPGGAADRKHRRARSKVFLSYSHADKDSTWFQAIQDYLKQLNVGGEVELWDDNRLLAGDDWLNEIEENLKASVAAVFVVTPTFITSEFIARKEVPKLLERLETDGLIVHALIGQPATWEEHPIGEFLERKQLVHSPERPLEAMETTELHSCLNQLVKQIRAEIGVHRSRYGHQRRIELMDEIDSQIQGDLIEEVAGGDTTIIYRAREGNRDLAVKAMVSRNISDEGQREIQAEMMKCQGLHSPIFIRMYDLSFDRGLGVATADWVPGRSLKRIMESPGSRSGDKWWERTTSIVLKLAEALAHGRDKKLRYINVNPAHILLHQGEPRIYPIDFSAWIASTAHAQGALSFTLDLLEYIAPEYLAKPAEQPNTSMLPGKIEDLELAMSRKADQYTLGMVALALLEGGPPVQVHAVEDIRRLLEFQAEPRDFLLDDKTRLGDRAWHREHPGLARVIWRMLAPNPDERWESMAVIADQLHIIKSSLAGVAAHVSEAKEHYSSYLRKNDDFYRRFYKILFRRIPDIAPMFANVDMTKQLRMLDGALERLLNFRPNQDEPTTLTEIAESHRRFRLTEENFEQFGHAFLESLDGVAGLDVATRDSWEAILWPGLAYMKRHATDQKAAE